MATFFVLLSLLVSEPDLRGFVVVVDPGHGGTAATDSFRVGPTGEREEWVNLRVALLLRDRLEAAGATVYLSRTEDVPVDLLARGRQAMEVQADVFVSLHHNATADPTVNYPVVYFHGSVAENQASVRLGQHLGRALREALHEPESPVVLVSDHTIFPTRGAAVLRASYGIPAVITEASFFTHPAEEARLKTEDWNVREAEALFRGIAGFLRDPDVLPILPYQSQTQVAPLPVLEQAERMRPEALRWAEDVEEARRLAGSDQRADLELALERATRSVQSFPDSPLAAEAHRLRAELFRSLGQHAEADATVARIAAYFPEVP